MNREPFPLRSLCVVAACLLALVLGAGCKSPQAVSGQYRNETRTQTGRVADQVNAAQQANAAADQADANADQALADLENMELPPEAKAKVVTARKSVAAAHAKRQAVESALKPIVPDILPKIDDAADKQLQATLDASNAARQKEEWIISCAVGLVIFCVLLSLKFGPAISAIGGLGSVLVTTIVIGIISDFLREWGPWAIGIAIVGAILLYAEKLWKGSWKATIHAAFDESKQAAKKLPADVDELWDELEKLKQAVPGFTPAPAPEPTKAA